MAVRGLPVGIVETTGMDSSPGWLAGPNNLEETVVVLLAVVGLAVAIAAWAMRRRRVVAAALALTTVLCGAVVGARAYSGAKHVHDCHTNNNDGCTLDHRHDDDGHTHWLLW